MPSLSLEQLPVLIIDCQTTGANPIRGHLIEIGWATVVPEEFRCRES